MEFEEKIIITKRVSALYKLWLFFLFFYLNTAAFSQGSSKNDTTKFVTRKFLLTYGCLHPSGVSNYNFRKDSILYDFFSQIDKNNFFNYKDTSTLLKLLDLAEGDLDEACFLPFLRLVDPEADKIYKENCYETGMQLPFPKYCIEPPIQFLILFYLQFRLADQLKLEQGVKISNIYLQNKKKAEGAELTQADYHTIYNLYRNWIVNAKSNKRKIKNPLKRSDYEWVMKYKGYAVISH